ncbi:MAG: zinc ribbon domain-containing protein [Nitrospinae bacterium]|nr:zinc ribbon domain-containing protein [Nitrospinota bacterium]
MPIYEYVCSRCGAKFEKLTPLAEAHKTQPCEACGERAGERILSATSLGGSHSHGGSCGAGGSGFG